MQIEYKIYPAGSFMSLVFEGSDFYLNIIRSYWLFGEFDGLY
jgi:hypothetical protein